MDQEEYERLQLYIGINFAVEDQEYLNIAVKTLQQGLPEGWSKETDLKGETVYFNQESKELTKEHPYTKLLRKQFSLAYKNKRNQEELIKQKEQNAILTESSKKQLDFQKKLKEKKKTGFHQPHLKVVVGSSLANLIKNKQLQEGKLDSKTGVLINQIVYPDSKSQDRLQKLVQTSRGFHHNDRNETIENKRITELLNRMEGPLMNENLYAELMLQCFRYYQKKFTRILINGECQTMNKELEPVLNELVEKNQQYKRGSVEELEQLAITYKIDLSSEYYLLWIPRIALSLKLPQDWQVIVNEKNNRMYKNLLYGVTVSMHPADPYILYLTQLQKQAKKVTSQNHFKNYEIVLEDFIGRPYDAKQIFCEMLGIESIVKHSIQVKLYSDQQKFKKSSFRMKKGENGLNNSNGMNRNLGISDRSNYEEDEEGGEDQQNEEKDSFIQPLKLEEEDQFGNFSDAELFALAQQCNLDVEQDLHLLNYLAEITTLVKQKFNVKLQFRYLKEDKSAVAGGEEIFYWRDTERMQNHRIFPLLGEIKQRLDVLKNNMIALSQKEELNECYKDLTRYKQIFKGNPLELKKKLQHERDIIVEQYLQAKLEKGRMDPRRFMFRNQRGKEFFKVSKEDIMRIYQLLGNKVKLEDVIDFTFQAPFRFVNNLRSSLATSLANTLNSTMIRENIQDKLRQQFLLQNQQSQQQQKNNEDQSKLMELEDLNDSDYDTTNINKGRKRTNNELLKNMSTESDQEQKRLQTTQKGKYKEDEEMGNQAMNILSKRKDRNSGLSSDIDPYQYFQGFQNDEESMQQLYKRRQQEGEYGSEGEDDEGSSQNSGTESKRLFRKRKKKNRKGSNSSSQKTNSKLFNLNSSKVSQSSRRKKDSSKELGQLSAWNTKDKNEEAFKENSKKKLIFLDNMKKKQDSPFERKLRQMESKTGSKRKFLRQQSKNNDEYDLLFSNKSKKQFKNNPNQNNLLEIENKKITEGSEEQYYNEESTEIKGNGGGLKAGNQQQKDKQEEDIQSRSPSKKVNEGSNFFDFTSISSLGGNPIIDKLADMISSSDLTIEGFIQNIELYQQNTDKEIIMKIMNQIREQQLKKNESKSQKKKKKVPLESEEEAAIMAQAFFNIVVSKTQKEKTLEEAKNSQVNSNLHQQLVPESAGAKSEGEGQKRDIYLKLIKALFTLGKKTIAQSEPPKEEKFKNLAYLKKGTVAHQEKDITLQQFMKQQRKFSEDIEELEDQLMKEAILMNRIHYKQVSWPLVYQNLTKPLTMIGKNKFKDIEEEDVNETFKGFKRRQQNNKQKTSSGGRAASQINQRNHKKSVTQEEEEENSFKTSSSIDNMTPLNQKNNLVNQHNNLNLLNKDKPQQQYSPYKLDLKGMEAMRIHSSPKEKQRSPHKGSVREVIDGFESYKRLQNQNDNKTEFDSLSLLSKQIIPLQKQRKQGAGGGGKLSGMVSSVSQNSKISKVDDAKEQNNSSPYSSQSYKRNSSMNEEDQQNLIDEAGIEEEGEQSQQLRLSKQKKNGKQIQNQPYYNSLLQMKLQMPSQVVIGQKKEFIKQSQQDKKKGTRFFDLDYNQKYLPLTFTTTTVSPTYTNLELSLSQQLENENDEIKHYFNLIGDPSSDPQNFFSNANNEEQRLLVSQFLTPDHILTLAKYLKIQIQEQIQHYSVEEKQRITKIETDLLWIPYYYIISPLPSSSSFSSINALKKQNEREYIKSLVDVEFIHSFHGFKYFKSLLKLQRSKRAEKFKELSIMGTYQQRRQYIQECSWLIFKEQRININNNAESKDKELIYYYNFLTKEKTYLKPACLEVQVKPVVATPIMTSCQNQPNVDNIQKSYLKTESKIQNILQLRKKQQQQQVELQFLGNSNASIAAQFNKDNNYGSIKIIRNGQQQQLQESKSNRLIIPQLHSPSNYNRANIQNGYNLTQRNQNINQFDNNYSSNMYQTNNNNNHHVLLNLRKKIEKQKSTNNLIQINQRGEVGFNTCRNMLNTQRGVRGVILTNSHKPAKHMYFDQVSVLLTTKASANSQNSSNLFLFGKKNSKEGDASTYRQIMTPPPVLIFNQERGKIQTPQNKFTPSSSQSNSRMILTQRFQSQIETQNEVQIDNHRNMIKTAEINVNNQQQQQKQQQQTNQQQKIKKKMGRVYSKNELLQVLEKFAPKAPSKEQN